MEMEMEKSQGNQNKRNIKILANQSRKHLIHNPSTPKYAYHNILHINTYTET